MPPGSGQFRVRTVRVIDQFVDRDTAISGLLSICAPVRVAGSAYVDATAHIACYAATDQPVAYPRQGSDVSMQDQFGSLNLRMQAPQSLCVPALKNSVPSALQVDRYKCYGVSVSPGTAGFLQRNVLLADPFETRTMRMLGPASVCSSVSIDGSTVLRPNVYLSCYTLGYLTGQSSPTRNVRIDDDFIHRTVVLGGGTALCVPASITP